MITRGSIFVQEWGLASERTNNEQFFCYICVLWETNKLQYPCTVMVMVQMMITFFVTARRNSEQEEAQSLCNKG